ncbi:MAG TPA: GNAT family N-acetyltransferase [Pyrinomonadaceae bacterium]|nr:GNAT family N-acetyltransferase [Pyrinomonadaceae bacterium]
MSDQLVIRTASKEDVRAITALINLAFAKVEQFFVEGDRISEAEVIEGMQTGVFLIAERNGEWEGCVYVEPRGTRAYLGLLSVKPQIQQRGTGSHLMNAAEEHGRNVGCEFMDIKIVNLRSDLPHFYSKRGYVETGTSPFPPEVETKLPCHFIDMSKRLV